MSNLRDLSCQLIHGYITYRACKHEIKSITLCKAWEINDHFIVTTIFS